MGTVVNIYIYFFFFFGGGGGDQVMVDTYPIRYSNGCYIFYTVDQSQQTGHLTNQSRVSSLK